MEYKIIPINNWQFKLRAPFYLKNDFKYDTVSLTWNYYLKRYVYKDDVGYLYTDVEGEGEILDFIFGTGWLPYILYHYEKFLDETSMEIINTFIDPLTYEFVGLKPEQKDDLNTLLTYRRGIFQVYTSYGKTQIIAHLINYIVNVRNERVLVLTPSRPALEEIDLRVESLFGLTHDYFDYDSNYNAINVNGFPRSYEFDRSNPYWRTVKWIIAEEVEYVISDTGLDIIELCKNAMRLYAFSATADKSSAERIVMREGNIPVVQRNVGLINYFGFSSVFKKPEDFVIELKEISTTIFNGVNDSISSNSNFTEIVYSIFTSKNFCTGLVNIVKKEKPLYIPMGSLMVIDNWIKNYFNIPDFVIINICSRGYELYIEGELIDTLTLEEVKMYIEDDQVDLITGTSSSYRALDFPSLNRILPLTSKLASIVIQTIGRVTRKKKFTILNLKPFTNVKIYTNDYIERSNLISSYFSDCKITNISKKDSDYGIN